MEETHMYTKYIFLKEASLLAVDCPSDEMGSSEGLNKK